MAKTVPVAALEQADRLPKDTMLKKNFQLDFTAGIFIALQ